MKNVLVAFLKNKNNCNHKNALLYSDCGYCPDCGEYLVKNYYLVRCLRCDIKREAKIVWGEVVPKEKFCSNCGARDFYIEKIDKVNFVDVNYAVYLKEIVNEVSSLHPEAQIWVDEGSGIVKQLKNPNG